MGIKSFMKFLTTLNLKLLKILYENRSYIDTEKLYFLLYEGKVEHCVGKYIIYTRIDSLRKSLLNTSVLIKSKKYSGFRLSDNSLKEVKYIIEYNESNKKSVVPAFYSKSIYSKVIIFTPYQEKIVELLCKGKFYSVDQIFQYIYSHKPECDWPRRHVITTFMCFIRKKLNGVDILKSRTRGYCISPDSLDAARNIYKQHMMSTYGSEKLPTDFGA